MRNLTSIISIVALTFALGCSSGSDDGDPPAVDGGPTVDSGPPAPDAMPTNPPITSGLGEICAADGSGTCTSAGTTGCVSVAMATNGFCTLQCATNIAMGAFPDAAATAACVAEYTGTEGTPVCATNIGAGVPDALGAATTNYACGIYCGMLGDPVQDLGGCPGGMTCTNNACLPD
jgi:hypothetical protein